MQGFGIMDMTVKHFVKDRHAFIFGAPQSDLHQRPAFDALLIVPVFSEGTTLAIKIGGRHVRDHAGVGQGIRGAAPLMDLALQFLPIGLFQELQRG
jgi:hypothetical protein